MYKLFYIKQRTHLNDLLKKAEELEIEPGQIVHRYMNILVANDKHLDSQEELDFAYKEVKEFYRKWKQKNMKKELRSLRNI